MRPGRGTSGTSRRSTTTPITSVASRSSRGRRARWCRSCSTARGASGSRGARSRTGTRGRSGSRRPGSTDLDSGLILSGAITPADRPEDEAAPGLAKDIASQGLEIGTLFIDRGYVKAGLVDEILGRGGEIVCRPWIPRNKGAFTKAVFKINMRDRTITCPAGEVEPIEFGSVTEFDPEACDHCDLRAKCTAATPGTGRSVNFAEDERLQQRLRKHLATPRGRARLRERVAVEHKLAHLVRRQGRRARYRGVRKNLFDLRRASAIQNLEAIQRKVA